jgi:hypothetical protein
MLSLWSLSASAIAENAADGLRLSEIQDFGDV